LSGLIDDEGQVYNQGPFRAGWQPKQGMFGIEKDTNLFGQPNIRQGLFGPVQARDEWGRPQYSSDDKPLYQRNEYVYSSGGGSSGGTGDLGALLAFGLVLLFVFVIGAILAALNQFVVAVLHGYHGLIRRYPYPMLAFHLSIGMGFVYLIGYLVGYSWEARLAGAFLVPGIWAWTWLTRKLPLVFMPINTILLGGCLWLVSRLTEQAWQPTWLEGTVGLPLINNLPLILALLPLSLWLLRLGNDHWPLIFQPIQLLITGVILWLLLTRFWTDWQPLWQTWFKPLPFIITFTGWIIFLLPLVWWIWVKGRVLFPLPFFVVKLIVFGGLLGLTAYHTESLWIDAWNHWFASFPFGSSPILLISLSPISLWTWSFASRRWYRYLFLPNFVLTGVILFLVMDRTRTFWSPMWQVVWGSVQLKLDPALFMLVFPLAWWGWKAGSLRWPTYWGFARAIIGAGMLWWLAERTRFLWQNRWREYAGLEAFDLAWISVIMLPGLWVWSRFYKRWPRISIAVAWLAVSLVSGWAASRIFIGANILLPVMAALLPLSIWGWAIMLEWQPWLGCGLAVLLFVIIVILVLFMPHNLERLIYFIPLLLESQFALLLVK
jgi:hypothetical protein